MATNNFYTGTTGLGVTALSVADFNSHTITAAIRPPEFTEIQAHGIKYKTQTFEDRPTVFGSSLRIQWMVSDFDVLKADDARDFAVELMRSNIHQLKAAIAKTCPDCLECPKCDIKVQQQQDDLRQRTNFIAQASCKSDRHTAHMTMCPTGKAAVLKGSTALVPDLAIMPKPQFTDIPTTMVPTREPQPYMRPTSPDTPMTAADEAW